METISVFEYVVFTLAAISAITLLAVAVGYRLKGQTMAIEEGDNRPLSEFRHRESLTMLLQFNRITGDADIRGGEVFPAVDPEKASVFSRMLMGAYSQAKANGMTSGSNVYFAVKNPGEGTGWNYHCFGDFGIGDAAAVAQLIDRQAAMISKLRKEIAALSSPNDEIKPRCKTCKGKGWHFNPVTQFRTKESCKTCGGSGKVEA